MTVRLVKRKELGANDEKQTPPPSPNQLIITTQNWVEEFRAQKARNQQSVSDLIRRS